MTPQQWRELLLSDTITSKQVRAVLAKEMRAYLSTLAPGITVSTNSIVQEFFPSDFAAISRANHDAQKALSAFILQLANSSVMEDCCMRGEINGQYMGKPKRPWLWFCPEERECCPMCGQTVPLEVDTSKLHPTGNMTDEGKGI